MEGISRSGRLSTRAHPCCSKSDQLEDPHGAASYDPGHFSQGPGSAPWALARGGARGKGSLRAARHMRELRHAPGARPRRRASGRCLFQSQDEVLHVSAAASQLPRRRDPGRRCARHDRRTSARSGEDRKKGRRDAALRRCRRSVQPHVRPWGRGLRPQRGDALPPTTSKTGSAAAAVYGVTAIPSA